MHKPGQSTACVTSIAHVKGTPFPRGTPFRCFSTFAGPQRKEWAPSRATRVISSLSLEAPAPAPPF